MRARQSIFLIGLCCLSAAAMTNSTVAQTSGANSETGTILITLGTGGGPLPTKNRMQSSNLLIVNGSLYLIDAGGGVTHRLAQSGYDFRQINKIFITHAHGDHSAGLVTLLSSAWEYKPVRPVDVYGSGTEALVKGAIDFLTPNAEIRWSEGKRWSMSELFRGHEVGAGLIYQDANVRVTAAENTHFNFQPGTPGYGKYHSYSYRFETPGRVVFFTGDTGPSDAVVELAKGADLYVTETTSPDDVVEIYKRNGSWQAKTEAEQKAFLRHMHDEHVTPEDIGKMAAKAGVQAIVMSHLAPSINANDDYQRFVDQAKKYYSGPITLARDLMKF